MYSLIHWIRAFDHPSFLGPGPLFATQQPRASHSAVLRAWAALCQAASQTPLLGAR